MNRKAKGLSLPQAIEGFKRYKVIEGVSKSTLREYSVSLRKFVGFLGDDCCLSEVSFLEVEEFLYWLKTEYKPPKGRANGKLSNKTIYNHYVALKSLFSWATKRGFVESDPMDSVPTPRFQTKPVRPFSREEIRALLDACAFTKRAETEDRRSFRMQRPTYRRDEAIVLFLLDSGLRASELCRLNVGDVNEETGEARIHKGKGNKGRTVYVGKGTLRALWRYSIERDDFEENSPLFASSHSGKHLSPEGLHELIKGLGDRAGISAFPHKFRHTFAITYLRQGGDLLTLQALLGHESLDMVRRYARVAQVDLQAGHRKASPVDSWGL